MITTVDLEKVRESAGTVYDAVVIIARRARQINMEQREMLEQETFDDMGDFDDDFEKAGFEEKMANLPKPSAIAMAEFTDGDLIGEYVEAEEDE